MFFFETLEWNMWKLCCKFLMQKTIILISVDEKFVQELMIKFGWWKKEKLVFCEREHSFLQDFQRLIILQIKISHLKSKAN